MKIVILSVISMFIINTAFAQIRNIKQGAWSDVTVWNSNSIPVASDDVVLDFDIGLYTNPTKIK